ETVVEGCPVPVIIAGGKKLVKVEDVLELTFNAIRDGAAGVDMGRNIWQSQYPIAMIKAVKSIVHENFSVKEAKDLFENEKKNAYKSTTILR
ncbi:MAG TPA: 3-hydroxy-5-phosphonooxypentane-2,4-dione thiolase LsrF, partial [Nitrososphaeraceae archaeon]|nr:3-hydroxy-5-phosphonooxypentane-2,4-dione thiolase LsrF [Nitrososphaeraceae archaeon]